MAFWSKLSTKGPALEFCCCVLKLNLLKQLKQFPLHLPQEAQTELVMLILLRLAEDVITFQALPPQRRRDIQQTLTQNMENIFSFMMAILQLNVEDYRRLVSAVSTFYFVGISS